MTSWPRPVSPPVDAPPRGPVDAPRRFGPPPSPCDMLPEMRQAYYRLIAGNSRQTIRYMDRMATYHAGDAALLKAEIHKLEILCNPHAARNLGRSVQAGRNVGHGGRYGYGGPYGYGVS